MEIANYLKPRIKKVFFLIYKFFLKIRYPFIVKKIIAESHSYKKVLLVFDFSCSSVNYGDFFYLLMLGRFFKILNKKVSILIIDDNPSLKSKYKLEIKEITGLIIKEKNILKFSTYKNFIKTIKINNEFYILFKKNVLKRKPIYNHAFNLANYLSKYLSQIQLDRMLLSDEDFLENKYKKITANLGKFIAIGCRFNPLGRLMSNLTNEEFNILINYLLETFPNHKIVVLSDIVGCKKFSKLIKIKDNRVLFSSHISSGYLESVSISMAADIFCQFRGGGIAPPRLFSSKPYVMFSPACFEIPVSENKFSFWTTKFQIYYTNKSKITLDNFKKEIYNLKTTLNIN